MLEPLGLQVHFDGRIQAQAGGERHVQSARLQRSHPRAEHARCPVLGAQHAIGLPPDARRQGQVPRLGRCKGEGSVPAGHGHAEPAGQSGRVGQMGDPTAGDQHLVGLRAAAATFRSGNGQRCCADPGVDEKTVFAVGRVLWLRSFCGLSCARCSR
ncbi:MAG: hypothetical protein HC869_09840 [Rhodospirillales bacterium]|nr:hypothetical protein [Rhodospirillales bacterium]